ncbi:MAG TPA: cytochrome c [Gammaproteobacteria bacterium]|nr:cytochrome c [Gammaproteobacteria bacterium]
MHKRLMTLAVTCLLAAGILPAIATADTGGELVAANCTSCHDDSVYTRKDRRVTSLAALKKQVQRCELSLGLKWFEEDVDEVVNYLNTTYYKFK